MDEKQKVLFCGDVEGRFNTLFSRLDAINKKSGPFDVLLCVGNFFGINNKEFEAYKSGSKKVAVPTYILGPNKEDHVNLYPEGVTELCPNVYYLGKRGVYTSSGGLKIAYISGSLVNDKLNSFNYTIDDVVMLRDVCFRGNTNFRGVDVLLTSQWPTNVTRFDTKCNLKQINSSNDLMAWLAIQLKPRYHISGLEGIYYERPPYRAANMPNEDPALEVATRFLGLARVGNPEKRKWIYALNLTPINRMKLSELIQKTTDETPCPYNLIELDSKLFNTRRNVIGKRQYFYDTGVYEDNDKPRKVRREKIVFDQSKCWFCLASPSVAKHLVVTVGNSTYLTLAKGGLVDEHFLICPIEHHQSLVSLSETIVGEIQEFKEAIRKFYLRTENVPVYFERNYKTSHMQIQVVPIPKKAAAEIKEIFMDEADGHGFRLEELKEHNRLDQVLPSGLPYFCVELPDSTILYTKIKPSMNFPINFGRKVLSLGPILNLPDREDWKNCILSKEDEESLVKRVRTDFEPYDITS